MASTLLLKRRIKTAQNVSKTTKAMQMIAASKLKRAQDATFASRPYVDKLTILAKNLSQKQEDAALHPYMQGNDSMETLLIVLSPDKGLCGGLITNLAREYMLLEKNQNFTTVTVGKKLEHLAAKISQNLVASFPFGNILPGFETVFPLENIINEYYLSGKVGKVLVLYNHFRGVFAQVPTLMQLLPVQFNSEPLISRSQAAKVATSSEESEKIKFEMYEPAISDLLPEIAKHYMKMSLYQRILESHLSEQAARMLAMQNATDNARDIITQLTLEYNKARQEKITNELLDISGGAAISYGK